MGTMEERDRSQQQSEYAHYNETTFHCHAIARLVCCFHLHDLVRSGVFVPGAGEQKEKEGVEQRDRNHFELF